MSTPLELNDLLGSLRDGVITPPEFARLESILSDNAEARRAYLEYMQLCASLRRRPTSALPVTEAPAPAASAGRSERLRITPVAWSIAAALLVAAVVIAIYFVGFNRQADTSNPNALTPIATVIESTGTLVVNDDIARPGGEYASGAYAIESGTAQFLLSNRVTVDLRGATRLHMHSPMRASLETGTAGFHCPPGSEGFTVDLPGGVRVRDLGTRFSVSSTDAAGYVIVREGRVSISSAAAGSVETIVAAGRVVRIGAGGAIEEIDLVEAQLVDDGGFESDVDDSPWTFTGNARPRLMPAHNAPVFEGRGVVILNPGQTAADGRLSQTIHTVPTVAYRLTLRAARRGVSTGHAALQIVALDAATGDELASRRVALKRATRVSGVSPDVFDTIRLDFAAAGPSTVIRIIDRSEQAAPGFDVVLDHVRVRSMPLDAALPDPSPAGD